MEVGLTARKNAKVATGCKYRPEKLELADFLLRHSREII